MFACSASFIGARSGSPHSVSTPPGVETLSRAAATCETINTQVTTLIGAIFRIPGRTAQAGVSITAAFLRWRLDLLSTSVHAVALRALSLVG